MSLTVRLFKLLVVASVGALLPYQAMASIEMASAQDVNSNDSFGNPSLEARKKIFDPFKKHKHKHSDSDRDERGRPGPQGPVGPQGPKGDTGDAGTTGATATNDFYYNAGDTSLPTITLGATGTFSPFSFNGAGIAPVSKGGAITASTGGSGLIDTFVLSPGYYLVTFNVEGPLPATTVSVGNIVFRLGGIDITPPVIFPDAFVTTTVQAIVPVASGSVASRTFQVGIESLGPSFSGTITLNSDSITFVRLSDFP